MSTYTGQSISYLLFKTFVEHNLISSVVDSIILWHWHTNITIHSNAFHDDRIQCSEDVYFKSL